MSFLPPRLLTQIRSCAKQLPDQALERLLAVLATQQQHYDLTLKAAILQQLPNASFRQVVADLLDTWYCEATHLSSQAIASALETAAYCEAMAREELFVELVWTGPDAHSIPLRRTDQVLLQLIQQAQQTLTIVSFAVYKIPMIASSLSDAINRGVSLRIIAETPYSGEGKIPFGMTAALGDSILRQAQVLVWPLSQRPKDKDGKHGSLHIKCVIADEKHLFLTSANLTEYAFTLNMEMGLLVHSQELAHQVNEHLNQLIHQGILRAG